MIAHLLERLAVVVVRRPGVAAVLAVMVTLVAVLLLPWFRVEVDVATLFPADHEAVELRRLTQNPGTTGRDLVAVVRGAPGELDGLVAEVERRLSVSPWLETVVARKEALVGERVLAARAAPLHHLPPAFLSRLEARLAGPERAEELAGLRDRIAQDPVLGLRVAREDPLGVRWIFEDAAREKLPAGIDANSPYMVFAGGTAALVRAQGHDTAFDMDVTKGLLADLRARLDGLDVELMGAYVTADADERRMRSDLELSVTVSFILVLTFLALSTRSPFDGPLLLLPVAVAIVWTLGFGGVLFGPFTPLAAGFAAVLAGLGVDFGIHWLLRYREERAQRDWEGAVRATARSTGVPILAGMLTTVLTFLTLLLSRFHGMASFALLLAMGLLAAFVTTLVLMPLLMRTPLGAPRAPRVSPVMTALGRLLPGRTGRVLVALVLVAAAAGWAVTATRGLTFDADPRLMRPSDDPVIASAARLESELGFSPLPVALLVDAGAHNLDEIAAGLDQLRRAGVARITSGPHELLGTGASRDRATAFRASVAGWVDGALEDLTAAGFVAEAFRPALEELEATLGAEPAGDVAEHQVTWGGRTWWLTRAHPPATLWEPEQRAVFAAAVRETFDGPVEIVSPYGLSDELTPMLAHDLTRFASVALLAVTVCVMAFTGSIWSGLLALLPTLCALGITCGVLSLARAPLHLANVIALPLIVGIGIDDGIHMVHRHRENRAAGALSVVATTGFGVWRTSVTTVLAFGSLALASSPGLASFGRVLVLGVSVCFVTSVLVLPRLLDRAAAGEA